MTEIAITATRGTASDRYSMIARDRRRAERALAAGRQAAHDLTASARAAAKRERVRLEIARRPRGQTEVIGHREDGRPIHRYVCAVRPRPYTPPEKRAAPKSYPSDAAGVEAAERAANPNYPFSPSSIVHNATRADQRAARKVRMAAKRRRGWL